MSIFDRLNDKSTYTGVYAERFKGDGRINADSDLSLYKGGASFRGNTNTGSNEVIRDISQVMRPNLRSDARPTTAPKSGASGDGVFVRRGKAAEMRRKSVELMGEMEALAADPDEQVKLLFKYYCAFGRSASGAQGAAENTLANNNFAKFYRECPGLLDRKITSTTIDLVFTSCKPKGERRVNFRQFIDALHTIAEKKFPEEDSNIAFEKIIYDHVLKNAVLLNELGLASPKPYKSETGKVAFSFDDEKEEEEYIDRKVADDLEEEDLDSKETRDGVFIRRGKAAELRRKSIEKLEEEETPRMSGGGSFNNATIAGEANKKGGIYDRLSNQKNFSGIYKRRFESGDGRINDATSLSAKTHNGTFKGNTNTRTDVVVHDISSEMRTNMRGGTRMKM